ncbi:MAG TPA: prepilin-type N-terminal cleavage/methylation domain-containing protein [Verrucomicrobiae bacterium]
MSALLISRSDERRGEDTPPCPDYDAPYSLCGQPLTGKDKLFAGFSLLEVMIAMAVFFIVVFAILGIVVQSLGAARALQQQVPDCGLVASFWSLSNIVEEGFYSGDLDEIVPGYAWEAEVPEPPGSNGLYLINIRVFRTDSKKGQVGESLSMLKFTGQRSKKP